MTYVFVGLVFLGLVSAVRVMLYGVERPRPAGDASPRSFSASPALLATFCFVAGIVGYSSMRLGFGQLVDWLDRHFPTRLATLATLPIKGREKAA